MSSKIRLSDVIKGGGAEFIFFGSGAPIIISGGQRFAIELRVIDNCASVDLVSSNESIKLCSGGIEDVTRAYQNLIDELRRTKKPSILKKHAKFFLGTAVGFIAASAVAFLAMTYVPSLADNDDLSDEAIFELLETMKSRTAAQAGLTSPQPLPGAPVIQQIVPQLQASEISPETIVSPIVERPDFLKKPVPTQEVPAKSETNSPETTASDASDTGFVIPDFDPEAYKAAAGLDTTSEATPKETPVTEEAPEAPAPQKEELKTAVEEVAVPDATPSPEAKNEAEVTEKEKEAATSDPHEPTSDKSSKTPKEEEFIPPSPEETQKRANEVVSSLLSDGMTQREATDVLQTLEALSLADFGEITPEMFSRLPHEVAQLLRDNGFVNDLMEPAYTDGVPHRIIRLPDAVVDQYRGRDGIPTIPEANTWAATGNSVRIPPPGGGDLKTPEDFAAFGIKLP